MTSNVPETADTIVGIPTSTDQPSGTVDAIPRIPSTTQQPPRTVDILIPKVKSTPIDAASATPGNPKESTPEEDAASSEITDNGKLCPRVLCQL